MTIAEIISIAIALIALFVTLYQITLSNRHQLFDKRITNYKLFVRLLEIYAHNRNNLLDNDDFFERPEKYFPWLTNSANLEEMSLLFSEPKNADHLLVFMHKCDELEEAHIESSLIWGTKDGALVSKFIKRYLFLLRHIYHRYSFLLDNPDSKNYVGQKASQSFICHSLDELDKAYQEIIEMKVEKKLLKKMKLGLGKTNDKIEIYH